MSEATWGIPVAVDLFFAGVGAGSFCFALLASHRQGAGWGACARLASFLAPLSIGIGLSMLLLDLRNKPRFWMTLTVFNTHSPMSWGVWLLSAFFLISGVYAFFKLEPATRIRIPWIGHWPVWNRPEWKTLLGYPGLLMALGISTYTGVLLSVSGVPLWRHWILPFLFVSSALCTGFAGGAGLGMLASRKGLESMREPLLFVKGSYRVLLPVYLAAGLFFAFSSFSDAAARGFYWLLATLALGAAAPWFLVMGKNELGARRACIVFGLILAGGFLLRTVLILAGQ